ncbi:hypothetical protein PHYSODRAFT_527603 [Phytophthora sojae]|uniref:Uncharacterized protein n=1 Tax=Phytophthora sojae (strain P6497) TaxID=1094619 RepID=G5A9E7_PHYSP|nr:hypothetical protein PHYSODRAFT_527603 [Phytophthora sojae]EGZ08522.1 hypothetical protein PHYSODRAFT_527603 [Phytophthora sojae]|eukprot:XP_009536694.1 hypothetical protein PHYSODRAFT_527603 [Phytophthora sojae]
METVDLLSKAWFNKTYLLLHLDKRHWMPQEFQVQPGLSALEETCKWMKLCEKVRNKNIALEAPIQEEIDQFAEFEAVYKAGFIEKDNAYEVEMKAKEDQLANERRFRETFGSDSDSEDA